MRIAGLICVAAMLAGTAQAQAVRVEIPIHQTVLPGGWIRYSVPLRVGTTDVEAMLDTGSTGLRILPGTLAPADFTLTDRSDDYAYGSGVRLEGAVAHAPLRLGELASSDPVPIMAVQSVDCVDRNPHCAASRTTLGDYRIGGDGLKGVGFKAIFGINLNPAEIDNPLAALGVRRWIVILPQPNDSAPGALILNPGDDEVAGYSLFRLPSRAAFMPGCIIADATRQKICGRVVPDSGAPGIMVASRESMASFPWPAGTAVTLVVQNDEGRQSGMRFTADSDASYALRLNRHWRAPFVRISGAAPYLSFAVLYDAEKGEIGLKPR